MSSTNLSVRVDGDSFSFENPAGEPFNAERALPKARLEAGGQLLSSRHALSAQLRERIAKEIQLQERPTGIWKQLFFSLLCIDGCVLGNRTWDMDRDVDILRREVAHALSQVFAPTEYRLEEYICEGRFTDGRVLLRVIFSDKNARY